jgi:hypothetical protein
MARTGLRMMPTFPSPSPKIRTVSFPQYGFKASLSGRAFLHSRAVKPAPGIPASPCRLHRPFARSRHGISRRALCPGRSAPPHAAVREASPRYPRGPWLRSELCCLDPSSRTTTPSVSLAGTRRFHGLPLIRRAFAVRERRGDPRDLPYFPCRAVHTCRRPYAGGSAPPSRCGGVTVPGFLETIASRHPRVPVSASNPRRG